MPAAPVWSTGAFSAPDPHYTSTGIARCRGGDCAFDRYPCATCGIVCDACVNDAMRGNDSRAGKASNRALESLSMWRPALPMRLCGDLLLPCHVISYHLIGYVLPSPDDIYDDDDASGVIFDLFVFVLPNDFSSVHGLSLLIPHLRNLRSTMTTR